MASPYSGHEQQDWLKITQRLIADHPLKTDVILDTAVTAWARLWNTTVGDAKVGIKLEDTNPPATVVGYFFEKLFAHELAARMPKQWIGGSGSQKDLHCITDPSKSIEIKSSGQLGYKVYGNRSYGQVVENADAQKKDKSGFYITVNFYGQTLTFLRFGWIDAEDWQAQKSQTGQMAGLSAAAYEFKLLPISGEYQLDGPIGLLPGVGGKAAAEFQKIGIFTIGDLLRKPKASLSSKQISLQAYAKETYDTQD